MLPPHDIGLRNGTTLMITDSEKLHCAVLDLEKGLAHVGV